jgi:hypothetical protein
MARPQSGSSWLHSRELFDKAVLKARDLGRWSLAKSNPVELRLVAARKRCIRTTVHGTTAAKKGRKRAMEPWLLATSLADATPEKVVKIYALRMQIEETFRDTKNHRFGWSFEDSRSTTCERIQVLLLIAVLGMLAVTLLGQAAERRGNHLGYQANRTTRKRRVLSLFFLGKNIIGAGDDHRYSIGDLRGYLEEIREKAPCLGSDVASDSVGIP